MKIAPLIIFMFPTCLSCYLWGEDDKDPIAVERDRQIAAALSAETKEATEHGDAKVQFKLGMDLFAQGPTHYSESIGWITKAADSGYAPAQYQLALYYILGLGVPRDITKAVNYLKMSADQGNDQALLQLGVLLLRGSEAIPQDVELAKSYLQKSIEKGNAEAKKILDSIEK